MTAPPPTTEPSPQALADASPPAHRDGSPSPGVTALPAALRALADALDAVLALAGITAPAPAQPRMAAVPEPEEPERLCRWCHHRLLPGMRTDAEYCTSGCRMAAWRQRTGRS